MNCARCSQPLRFNRHVIGLYPIKLRRTGDEYTHRDGHVEEKFRCPRCGAIFWFPKSSPVTQ